LIPGIVLLLKDFFVGRSVLESCDVVCDEVANAIVSVIERKMFDFMLFFALIVRLGVWIWVVDGVEVGVDRRTIAVVVGCGLRAAAKIFLVYELLLTSWFGGGQESTLCRAPPLTFTSRMVFRAFGRCLPEEIDYSWRYAWLCRFYRLP
jgi:hypothetical protein